MAIHITILLLTQLLGYMDMDTREWFDGVLTAAAREVVRDSGTSAWIICDGDIDPEWIEALNSVLDDNRLVSLFLSANFFLT